MDKRLLVAALLCALFLSVYSQMVLRPVARPRPEPTRVVPAPTQPPRTAMPPSIEEEAVITIASVDLILEIGQVSGNVRRATLPRHLDASRTSAIRFGHAHPLLSFRVNGSPLSCRLAHSTANAVELLGLDDSRNNYHIYYTLRSNNHLMDIVLEKISSQVTLSEDVLEISQAWERGDKLSNRYNQLEISMLQNTMNGAKPKYAHHIAPFRQEKRVPRGTSLLTSADRYFCLSLRPDQGQVLVTLLPSAAETIATGASTTLASDAGRWRYSATAYIGPRGYSYLERAGFKEAFPIGFLGHIGLALLGILSWLAGLTRNYGVAVILLSVLVTLVMAPFTLVSFRSMKKMQELKPQIDKIMAKHKAEPQQANREVFALYKQHRVSPLGGCLPMLLQIPIFIALFQAISHEIELRGKSFLWIHDLSLPDRLATLPFSLPFLGSDLNLLPIVMAAAMFFQTRLSQQSMPSDQSNPMTAMMSGPLMSVLFGVMFYQFPSGLVLYWLTNSLMSLGMYRLYGTPSVASEARS